jgi:hypothetical protein
VWWYLVFRCEAEDLPKVSGPVPDPLTARSWSHPGRTMTAGHDSDNWCCFSIILFAKERGRTCVVMTLIVFSTLLDSLIG